MALQQIRQLRWKRKGEVKMHTTIRDLFAAQNLTMAQPGTQNDQSDMGQDQQQQQGPQMPSEVASAPYIKLLTKLGYEYQGSDEELGGNQIGSSFTGPDGDMIFVRPDGGWMRMGPGAQRTQGKTVQDLGNALVRDSLQQGDDQNTHAALRQSGYNKIHTDADGNSYYKHPQTGATMHVRKDGSWGHSSGTGKGANKMRDFLGNESMNNQDPQMMQMKLKTQQMKQQQDEQRKTQRFGPSGTRGGGTRGPAGSRFGGRGGF